MRSNKPRLLPLALLLAPLAACATPNSIPVAPLPPVADLTVEPKPLMPVEAITDDTAAAAYSSSVESWGDRGWAAVGRLCRWAKANGEVLDCPALP